MRNDKIALQRLKRQIEFEANPHKASKLLKSMPNCIDVSRLLTVFPIHVFSTKVNAHYDLWKVSRLIRTICELNPTIGALLIETIDFDIIVNKIKSENCIYKIGMFIKSIRIINKKKAQYLITKLQEKYDESEDSNIPVNFEQILLNPKSNLCLTYPFAKDLKEEECRRCFEDLYNKKFPKKTQISWLSNARGNLMELDGYCRELQLAFEYHGIQHFKNHSLFHKHSTLKERKIDDELKRKGCVNYGVTLIEIPYTVKNLSEFITKQCLTLKGKIKLNMTMCNSPGTESCHQLSLF